MYEDKDKCDIIDIANKEMERDDIAFVDRYYQDMLKKEMNKSIIRDIFSGENPEEALKMLQTLDILAIRTTEKAIYFKTKKSVKKEDIINALGLNDFYLEEVPIKGKYNFFRLDKSYMYEKRCDYDIPKCCNDNSYNNPIYYRRMNPLDVIKWLLL